MSAGGLPADMGEVRIFRRDEQSVRPPILNANVKTHRVRPRDGGRDHRTVLLIGGVTPDLHAPRIE